MLLVPFTAMSLIFVCTRQQLSAMQQRSEALEDELSAARAAADEARTAAAKAEADLADLSAAYNALEAHSFQVEEQLRSVQSDAAAAASSSHQSTGVSEEEMQQRIQEAVHQVQTV